MDGSAPREDDVGGVVARPGGPAGPSPSRRGPRATGRRVAMASFYLVAAGLSLGSTAQLVQQVFLTPGAPAPAPTCHEGLLALAAAVERARGAASGSDGEDLALTRFRQGLEPEWSGRDAIARSCAGDKGDERALDAIERLRYAEEHAVRKESGDLAPLRRRVRSIVETDLRPHPR